MNNDFQEVIRSATTAVECFHIEDIQSLWSGYGKIMRYGLKGGSCERVVVKHVKLPDAAHHPRGWDTDLSHQRKVKSYHVESAWYRGWAGYCDETCRVPACLALDENDDEFLMVFEDLDASGFPVRKDTASMLDMKACLRWLANFHAIYMGRKPDGLWKVGTYWHLDTRPDELEALDDPELKAAAKQIDERLNSAQYQTIVHGDAKLANFCFSEKGEKVAAVDFQYVGGGCGMKDVAYFIGSCLYEEDCERYESQLLDYYFSELKTALAKHNGDVDSNDVENEWRELFPVAWTDFHRFMKGWSPGHWKIHGYSERISRQVLADISKQLPEEDLRYLSGCAISAAKQAGEIIKSYASKKVDVKQKDGGDSLASQVVTEVDLLSEKAIVDILKPACEKFGHALLTEESADDMARLEKDYFWCVDPMDGTLSFIESTPGYAVSIALVSRSGEPIIGVVYDPVTDTLISAVKGQGVYRNSEPWQPGSIEKDRPLTLVCDRGFTENDCFIQVYEALKPVVLAQGYTGIETLEKNGAAMNACYVLENPPAVYFKFPKRTEGGGSLWDFAATAAIFNEAGCCATDFYGQPLDLNRADSSFMNHRGVLYVMDTSLSREIQGLYSLCSEE